MKRATVFLVKQWRFAKYIWRLLLRRIGRGRAALALAFMFALGLSEPLLCLIHCQIFSAIDDGMPMAHSAMPHHLDIAPLPSASAMVAATLLNCPLMHSQSDPSQAPTPLPRMSIDAAVLLSLALLGAPLLLVRLPLLQRLVSTLVDLPAPFRPPISPAY